MDIILKDVASGGSIEIFLPVEEDIDGDGQSTGPRYREFRAPLIPPRISQGDLQWSHQDPLRDFVFSQDDWSDGALRPYYRPDDRRYVEADGVDLRWEGVAALSMEERPNPWFILRNGGAEENGNGGWTPHANITLTTPTGSAADTQSTRGFHIVTDGSRVVGDDLMTQTITSNEFQNRSVKITAMARRTSGGNLYRLRIQDSTGAGAESPSFPSSFTEGDTVATLTVNGGATSFTVMVRLVNSNESGVNNIDIDDINLEIDGVTPTCTGVAVLNGTLYGAFGRVICSYNAANHHWSMVRIHQSLPCSDIITFSGNLYTSFGTTSSYEYSNNGTSWIASTRTDPDDKAIYWAIAGNNAGTTALWKTETTTAVTHTTNGTEFGGVAWSSPISVGSTDNAITELYGVFDTLVVAKQDGIWMYDRWDPNSSAGDNTFFNVTSEWASDPQSALFQRGVEWQGWLYLPSPPNSLERWSPVRQENLGGLLSAPRLSNIGGDVQAIGADHRQLWMIVGAPSSGVNNTRLILMSWKQDDVQVHVIKDLGTRPSTGNLVRAHNGILHLMGTSTENSTEVVRTHAFTLPTNSQAPYADTTPSIGTIGDFDASIWHGNFPDTPKAFLALTIWCEDLDAQHTIVARFGIDGASSRGQTLGTFNGTGRIQTIFFHTITNPETNAVGRAIQLNFELTTDDTVSPKLYSFALHSTLRPEKFRVWEFDVRVEAGARLDTGFRSTQDMVGLLANLNTLEDQDYPFILREDMDGDGTPTETTVHMVDRQIMSRDERGEVHRLVLQEADTS